MNLMEGMGELIPSVHCVLGLFIAVAGQSSTLCDQSIPEHWSIGIGMKGNSWKTQTKSSVEFGFPD